MVKARQKKIEPEEEENKQIYDMVNDLVKKSHAALDQWQTLLKSRLIRSVKLFATAGEQMAYPLARWR